MLPLTPLFAVYFHYRHFFSRIAVLLPPFALTTPPPMP